MTNKRIWMGALAIALVFGMTVAGCDEGASDPIDVDLSLPAIKDVAPFEGTFVTSEAGQQALISEAVSEISALSDIQSSKSVQYGGRSIGRSISRSVREEPIEEIYVSEEIYPGAVATGFVKGYYKESVKDDNRPGESAGDWYEGSINVKVGVDFTNVKKTSYSSYPYPVYTFNGKYIYNESLYEKLQVTSVNPEKEKVTIKLNVENGYALSVSKGGNGLKFLMKLKISIDKTFDSSEIENEDDDIFDKYGKFELTIEVYDNSDTKQDSKSFKNFKDAEKYLGDSINGLMDF